MKSSYTIPAAIVIAGIILSVSVYVWTPKPAAKGGEDASLMHPVSSYDHILGNPDAQVFIVEYTDFDCEACKAYHGVLQQIIANKGAGGKVAWVFRQFPLTELHPNAMSLARAAECASIASGPDSATGNSAFWAFATTLFNRQPVDPSTLGTIASLAGVPGDAFAQCYANAAPTVDARILADRQNALDMGAPGTPFAIVMSKNKPPYIMDSAYTYDAVSQLVDQALGK
jgi:protein-disulfide isomerase